MVTFKEAWRMNTHQKSATPPLYPSKEPCIRKWAQHRKRALSFHKRALYQHLCNGALYKHQKSPVSPQKSPIFPQKSAISTCLHQSALLTSLFRQKSPASPQKSPIFPQKSPVFPQNSPASPHKSPIFPQKSPVCPQKSPALPQKSLQIRRRALHFRKRALSFRERDLHFITSEVWPLVLAPWARFFSPSAWLVGTCIDVFSQILILVVFDKSLNIYAWKYSEYMHLEKSLQFAIYGHTNKSYKRDLHVCKRDLYICKRDLYICKRDLYICKRAFTFQYMNIQTSPTF